MAPRKSSAEAPVPDIYVGLLFVSFSALIAGTIMLVLELQKYGWQLAK
jgi:hypothetical protein